MKADPTTNLTMFESCNLTDCIKPLLCHDSLCVSPICRAVHKVEEAALLLHPTMFSHAIYSQMSDEQHVKWLDAAFSFTLLGTYAQTELGHGTKLSRSFCGFTSLLFLF